MARWRARNIPSRLVERPLVDDDRGSVRTLYICYSTFLQLVNTEKTCRGPPPQGDSTCCVFLMVGAAPLRVRAEVPSLSTQAMCKPSNTMTRVLEQGKARAARKLRGQRDARLLSFPILPTPCAA